jgi:uncharacterized protein with HEPN domain
MRKVEVEIYKFDELSDKGKQKVIRDLEIIGYDMKRIGENMKNIIEKHGWEFFKDGCIFTKEK